MSRNLLENMCVCTSIPDCGRQLLVQGEEVNTGHWQALKDVPQTKTIECQNVVLQMQVGDPDAGEVEWIEQIGPNLPWAEDQFQERVAGKPVNPGETYKDWPYYKGNVEQHQKQREFDPDPSAPGVAYNAAPEQFSHTYMERFWPRHAGEFTRPGIDDDGLDFAESSDAYGIRYDYGDLNDVVNLLVREPYTRQAYLPIWFPEDTGAHHGERVPCTLGYHFMLREGKLNISYFIRSVDMIRHFPDDVYMAMRLCQWVLQQVVPRVGDDDHPATREELEGNLAFEAYAHEQGDEAKALWSWAGVKPGILTMHMCSLHFFDHESDWRTMRKLYG